MVTVSTSHEHEATVGIIRFAGFPVWFQELAPGISIMSSWHDDRFLVNTGVWIVGLLSCALLIGWKLKQRNNTGMPTIASTLKNAPHF